MKFGKVTSPELIDFTLPDDHPDTAKVLQSPSKEIDFKVYTGCTKWSKSGLPGFYPPGTQNELGYYARQFNAIEFNATFYRVFPADQYLQWKDMVPDNFRFFPKVEQFIGHLKRLTPEGLERLQPFLDSTLLLGDKLGTIFLQLHPNFSTKFLDRVLDFIELWPENVSCAIEFRDPSWYGENGLHPEVSAVMKARGMVHILTDTAGRRDLLHMQLTSKEAFIRFVAVNHDLDHSRIEEWVKRIVVWKKAGLHQLEFFIHQEMKKERPFLASFFMEKLNKALGTDKQIPRKHWEINTKLPL